MGFVLGFRPITQLCFYCRFLSFSRNPHHYHLSPSPLQTITVSHCPPLTITVLRPPPSLQSLTVPPTITVTHHHQSHHYRISPPHPTISLLHRYRHPILPSLTVHQPHHQPHHYRLFCVCNRNEYKVYNCIYLSIYY